MTMKTRYTYILFIVACLLSVTMHAQPEVVQPAKWSSTPTMSEDIRPTYKFGSTSSYTPIVGNTNYLSNGSGPVSSPRREQAWNPWGDEDDPDGDPMGQLGQTPVGEPLILLVMASLYLALLVLWRRRKSACA